MRIPLSAAAFALAAAASVPAAEPVTPAPSKITAVTVYLNTALVTREVTVPEAAGLHEVVVSPLPPATTPSSLYAEGGDGLRVMSARFRTRAIAEDNRPDVRKLEAKIKELQKKLQQMQAELGVQEQNKLFMNKLEGFTAATLNHLTDKGQLDSEKTIALATFIKESRTKAVKDEVTLKESIQATQEELQFTQRQLDEGAGTVSRTERDAIIVVEKKAGAGTVRLNYLVSDASWRPQYKLRAGTKDKDPVTLEYLSAVTQQTGEDWPMRALTLSTAEPCLNSAPPDLLALEIGIGKQGVAVASGVPLAAGPGGVPANSEYLQGLQKQSQELRSRGQDNLNKKMAEAGGKDVNDAAALDQFRELLLTREDVAKGETLVGGMDGPSVTFRLKDRLTLPSRNDEQVLEVARLELAPRFYYKAVPVSSNVYRIADLTNTSELVLLPGEATMYLGTDFVGQTKLPLVAVGKPFTLGFGADPQLQVTRKLMDKTRTTQGGNQVLTFKYRILLSSYKTTPVEVQVWDRMPHAEAQQTIAVTLTPGSAELSKDPLYLRDERPRGLLRWDVKLEPKQNGEKALAIDYEYKIELDRTVTIGAFLSK